MGLCLQILILTITVSCISGRSIFKRSETVDLLEERSKRSVEEYENAILERVRRSSRSRRRRKSRDDENLEDDDGYDNIQKRAMGTTAGQYAGGGASYTIQPLRPRTNAVIPNKGPTMFDTGNPLPPPILAYAPPPPMPPPAMYPPPMGPPPPGYGPPPMGVPPMGPEYGAPPMGPPPMGPEYGAPPMGYPPDPYGGYAPQGRSYSSYPPPPMG